MTRPKSERLKTLQGTARPGRARADPHACESLMEAPPAPAYLTPSAAGEWDRLASILVERSVLTRGDLRALELLAETLASCRAFAVAVATDGTLIESARGRKANPALAGLGTARAQ